MPATYIPIASTTLSSSAASVTFSSIPQTYTDLVVRASTRSSLSGFEEFVNLRVNGLTTSIYSGTRLRGTGSTASSTRNSNQSTIFAGGGFVNGGFSTTNTFTNVEIYLPNYTASQNKVISTYSATEQNSASENQLMSQGALAQTTSAVTSISLTVNSSDFVAGSTFHLYGIKKN